MGPGFESPKVHQTEKSVQSVFLTQWVHPFPYRTRKLSAAVVKILGWRRPGKIAQRRHKRIRILSTDGVRVGYFNAVGPPVPIPNTEVKRCSGENTWLETTREDSSWPTSLKGKLNKFPFCFIFLLSSVGSADRDLCTKRLCIRIYKTAV